MNNRHRIVKITMKGFGLYLFYNIFTSIRKEYVVEQARVIREQQVRFGGDFELSQEKQRILAEADEYLDNHSGYRYLNRMRTEEFFEQQITKIMTEKEKALAETPPEEQEKIDKLNSHIEQLKRAYTAVIPKMPTSWEDLREKDEEDE